MIFSLRRQFCKGLIGQRPSLSKLRAVILLALLPALLPVQTMAKPSNPDVFRDYLIGSYANYLDDKAVRSQYYSRAFSSLDTDVRLGRLAMVAAIEAGDMKQAIALAKRVTKTHKKESLARALLGVEAFKAGRNSKAAKYFDATSVDVTMALLMQLVSGWNEYDRGKSDAARKIFENMGGAGFFKTYGQLQLAKLESFEGNFEAAEAAFAAIEATDISGVETAIARAYFHLQQDDTAAALSVLQDYDSENDSFGIGPVPFLIAQIKDGTSLSDYTSAKHQAARALTDPSLLFFYRNRSIDGAEIYLRFARWIDPNYHKSAIWLGDLLDNSERADEGYALNKDIKEGSPYYVSARLNVANYFFDNEQDERALKILESLSQSHPSFITREALGRARFFREDFEGALPFYNDIVNSMDEAELKDNVMPLRLRGIIYERTDQWPLAEKDFKRVLELSPDDVETLNYLGYTWVDRGENLKMAFDMIRKAVAAEPESGAIVDSLGWAHYKLGEYQEAKVNLEKAVVLSPSSATIIDHLGDVYWKLGRKREARFQWQRALEFEPTDKEKVDIDLKLKSGLSAVISQ